MEEDDEDEEEWDNLQVMAPMSRPASRGSSRATSPVSRPTSRGSSRASSTVRERSLSAGSFEGFGKYVYLIHEYLKGIG